MDKHEIDVMKSLIERYKEEIIEEGSYLQDDEGDAICINCGEELSILIDGKDLSFKLICYKCNRCQKCDKYVEGWCYEIGDNISDINICPKENKNKQNKNRR